MYRYISGIVVEKGLDYVVLDVAGIGYKLFASLNTIKNIAIDTPAKLYTIMMVKEDDISLCGFAQDEEREFFEYLTSVSGIGKKNAMNMLGFANFRDIAIMIINDDLKKLSTLPGVGKKTAQRLVVELKDTLKKRYEKQLNALGLIGSGTGDVYSYTDGLEQGVVQTYADSEVHQALETLGFSRNEIAKMLNGVDVASMSVEQAIAQALSRK